jgi:hypothetical protein
MFLCLFRIGAGVSLGLAIFAWTLGYGGAALLLAVIAVCFYLSRHE